MLFVSVHCEDELDRTRLIPLHKVDQVDTNADGSDYITVGTEIMIFTGASLSCVVMRLTLTHMQK